MKKLTLSLMGATALLAPSLVAHAADLPRAVPVKAPVVVPVYNWTGFYIGGNIGGAWADVDVSSNVGVGWGASTSAFIGGAQMGYNWQFNTFVAGIEADFDWTDASKTSGTVVLPGFGALQARGDWDWTSTIAGRFGFAADRVLFYGKLGVGWSRTSARLQTPGGVVLATSSNTNVGWLVGAGIEYAFAQNWTAKVEYNYLALEDRTFVGPFGTAFTADPDIQMVKFGINYKFGGPQILY